MMLPVRFHKSVGHRHRSGRAAGQRMRSDNEKFWHDHSLLFYLSFEHYLPGDIFGDVGFSVMRSLLVGCRSQFISSAACSRVFSSAFSSGNFRAKPARFFLQSHILRQLEAYRNIALTPRIVLKFDH
jgi:hypothetical protein